MLGYYHCTAGLYNTYLLGSLCSGTATCLGRLQPEEVMEVFHAVCECHATLSGNPTGAVVFVAVSAMICPSMMDLVGGVEVCLF